MTGARVLFVSGSSVSGTRHGTSRRRHAGRTWRWRSCGWPADPAGDSLTEAGERCSPGRQRWATPAEQAAEGFALNLVTYMRRARTAWARSGRFGRPVPVGKVAADP